MQDKTEEARQRVRLPRILFIVYHGQESFYFNPFHTRRFGIFQSKYVHGSRGKTNDTTALALRNPGKGGNRRNDSWASSRS